jgi:hypothetical protein
LRQIIDHDLQSTIDAAVVEVEPKSADFEGFPPTLVLACIDSGIECFQQLVVSLEERVPVDFGIPMVAARLYSGGNDYNAFLTRKLMELQIQIAVPTPRETVVLTGVNPAANAVRCRRQGARR